MEKRLQRYKYNALKKSLVKYKDAKLKKCFRIFHKILTSYADVTVENSKLIFDTFAILLKKKLYAQHKVRFAGVGLLYIKKRRVYSPIIRFSTYDKLSLIINSDYTSRVYVHGKDMTDLFSDLMKCLGLSKKHCVVVYKSWIEAARKSLKELRYFVIPAIGFIYVIKVNYKEKYIPGLKREVRNFYRVKFKTYKKTSDELQEKRDIFAYKRIKQIISLNKISLTLKGI